MNRIPTLNPQIPRKSELFYKPESHMRLWLYILIGRKYGFYTIINTISSNSMHILYDILLANRQYTNQKGCYGE